MSSQLQENLSWSEVEMFGQAFHLITWSYNSMHSSENDCVNVELTQNVHVGVCVCVCECDCSCSDLCWYLNVNGQKL